MTTKEDIFRPQAEFPLLEDYKKVFEITNKTIFAYDNKIYCDYPLTPDLVVHEYKHWEQQNEIGLDRWVEMYLTNNNFRLTMEIEAYRAQLLSIKDREVRNKVRLISARQLSSELYGNIITKEDAFILLK